MRNYSTVRVLICYTILSSKTKIAKGKYLYMRMRYVIGCDRTPVTIFPQKCDNATEHFALCTPALVVTIQRRIGTCSRFGDHYVWWGRMEMCLSIFLNIGACSTSMFTFHVPITHLERHCTIALTKKCRAKQFSVSRTYQRIQDVSQLLDKEWKGFKYCREYFA